MDRNDRAHGAAHCALVALRKESVDRNGTLSTLIIGFLASLSARRAWIEIEVENGFAGVLFVALRKESVDRNFWQS